MVIIGRRHMASKRYYERGGKLKDIGNIVFEDLFYEVLDVTKRIFLVQKM